MTNMLCFLKLNYLSIAKRISGNASGLLNNGHHLLQGQNLSAQRNSSSKPCRIGCASGFWGDTPTAVRQLVSGGQLDYLILDYLSEITMSLLTSAKAKNSQLGYAPDFVSQAIGPSLKAIKDKGIKVISNAGGINPTACGAAIQAAAQKAGIDIKVGVVTGDDLMPVLDGITNTQDMNTGAPLPSAVSANAYIGAGSIVRALELGADVVVTGRAADSSLALAPAMYHHGWDSVSTGSAGASVAGHLIECGAQCTGGNFTDWRNVTDPHKIGFPIASVASDGSCIISKPPNTGGALSYGSVCEQLLYEVGDPRAYVLPDLAVDMTGVRVEEVNTTEPGVSVTGARALPATDSYKVGAIHLAGYKSTVVCCIGGPDAADKARRTASSVLERVSSLLKAFKAPPFSGVHIQVLGAEDSYGPRARRESASPREAVLWMSVQHAQKDAVLLFAREIAAEGTGGVPGLMGLVGGRPKPVPVLKLHSFLIPKKDVPLKITVGSHSEDYVETVSDPVPYSKYVMPHQPVTTNITTQRKGNNSYPLSKLAYTRSGDKGDSCNIGVVSRHPSFLPYIQRALTADAVSEYMSHVFSEGVDPRSCVKRYEVEGISALNFVLEQSLGGGGIASLRPDAQGKAYGQMLLDFEVPNMPSIEELTKGY